MCGREFVCGGVGWWVGLGCRGGLTAEQKMTVVLSVPVVWFGPGSLPHVGKTTISQHDASTFLQNRPTEKAYSAIFSCCYFNNKNYHLHFFLFYWSFRGEIPFSTRHFLENFFSATTVKAFCIYSFLEKMKNLSDTVRRVLTGKHVQLVVQQVEGGRAST